jgi:prepilin-type processing-associated H-X9-DG protein
MLPLTLANMFIPYFTGQTKAGFLLLIPVIIVEALLLISILRTKWLETFKLCAIANIVSTIAGAIFIILEFTTPFVPVIGILLIVPGTLGLSIWIEYEIYKKPWQQVAKRKLLKAVIIVNVITYIPLLVLAFHIHDQQYRKRMEKPRRIASKSNLKQIGLALKQYAMDYNNFLPDKSAAAGFEQLRNSDYLNDYGVYVCPFARHKRGKDDQKLTEDIVSYIYKGGYQDSDKKEASKIPIAWDKPTNHENYGNVLFLDGHVEGFKGADWMEQAGIKKSTIQQGE